MLLLSVISLISAFSFVACTFVSLSLAILGDFGGSIGFGILAGIWFVLMVLFGHVYATRS